MQEVRILILIRIMLATQIWNPIPEKILLTKKHSGIDNVTAEKRKTLLDFYK